MVLDVVVVGTVVVVVVTGVEVVDVVTGVVVVDGVVAGVVVVGTVVVVDVAAAVVVVGASSSHTGGFSTCAMPEQDDVSKQRTCWDSEPSIVESHVTQSTISLTFLIQARSQSHTHGLPARYNS